MASTNPLEKCPEIAQLMDVIGKPGHDLTTENLPFLKRGLRTDFQCPNNERFGRINCSKRRLRGDIYPLYRLINVYHKSTEQYWKERNRRKKVLELAEKGFRHKDIAEQLRVSTKTVQRDLKKIRPYFIRKIRNMFRQFEEERQRRLHEQMAGMNLLERVKFLSSRIKQRRKLWEDRDYKSHYTIFHLDLTQPDKYGIPKLTILPHQTKNKTLAYPYKIRVMIKGAYEGRIFEADLGGFNIVQTVKHRW